MWKDSKNPQDRKKPQSTQWHQAPPPAPMGSSPYRGGVVWGSLWPLELRQQGHPSWTGQRVETRPRVIPPMYQVDQLNHQDLLAVCWHQLHWRECVPALVLLPPSEPQLLFFTKCNYIDYWDDFDLPWPLLVTWSQPDAPVMAEVISELEMIPSQHRQCSRGINTKWICGLLRGTIKSKPLKETSDSSRGETLSSRLSESTASSWRLSQWFWKTDTRSNWLRSSFKVQRRLLTSITV